MQILSKSKLEEALNQLGKNAELFVPLARGEESGFYPWSSYQAGSDRLMLDALNVLLPPKSVVFPQTERMYSFTSTGPAVEIKETFESPQPRIIFGLRACDAAAIACFDDVFLTMGFIDSFYQARRDNTTIVAHACYEPGANCFCEAMGVDPTEPVNADVIIRDAGEVYIWESKSSKGEKLTAALGSLLENKEAAAPGLKPFQQQANYEGVAEKLKGMFEDPIWEQLAATCQTCGICTYVCPSCYCFDIQVKSWGEEGYRFRCYDSCMYSEYTQMAGGHNPRGNERERFRNRFLHKLQFFSERYGKPLCTGCGRCIVACPAGINIVEIINNIKEADTSVRA
ncbi:MAG TPA: 4Fe-4S ferredoxin [Gelria sp.]|jgi:sulfhydrogenase subunit beta (sulfur reductase)|nr:4Fe-4S ferredoxin [Gelria sp.]